MPVREEALNWFEEARADLRHGENSVGLGDYSWAAFAAQQAAEKAHKALALHVKGEYARGYDLVRLYHAVREAAPLDLDVTELSRLTIYYTQTRYPNAGLERPSEEITRELAEEALRIARKVVYEVGKAFRDP